MVYKALMFKSNIVISYQNKQVTVLVSATLKLPQKPNRSDNHQSVNK